MSEPSLTVNLVLESEKAIAVPYTKTTTAEDVCVIVCKHLNIGTLAKHLFALRVTGKGIFLMPNATFGDKSNNVDFRIRFKVAHIGKLKISDISAYNYYFQQARADVLENKIPGLVYEKYRRELLGLGITDMYRVILEKGISREIVESEYKKYVPKDVLKKHAFFIKKPIHDHLVQLEKNSKLKPLDASFVKAQYINQLELIAPEYLSETYKAVADFDGQPASITLKVSPAHVSEPGVKYCTDSKKDQWILLCAIEELGFIAIRNDGAIEISRINGIPIHLKFHTIPVMWSFITLLDGYYRLTCKWTFNLCQELETSSLRMLHYMKCHGPVGGEFSYAKLEAKTSNKSGCFIIRESETSYNSYYIDVCVKDSSKPKTFKLERLKEDEFIFSDDVQRYKSIQELVHAYSEPEGAIYLKECLPPSEYDISPLLLCRSDNVVGDSLTDSSSLPQLIPCGPVCINYKDLQVYKGQRKEGSRNITHVYRGMWKVTRGKKVEVALKFLKQESREMHIKDYLNLIGQWAFLKSSTVVRLFGIAFSINDICLVMEYFKLGPLDQYLRVNKGIMKTVDLIEASSNLASALWYLKENDIVHGRIRCSKLMVYCHEENAFTVKLADPGVYTSYEPTEIHWIPVECYRTLEKRSTAVDVWAMATTLFEIFTYGKKLPESDHIQAMRWYLTGKRLPQPPGCPNEIYTLMTECWHADPHRRKQPQELSRDVNQLLYQVYNSRKKHWYDTVGKPLNAATTALSSSYSLNSVVTDTTDVYELISANDPEISSNRSGSSLSETSSQQWLLHSQELVCFDPDLGDSRDFSQLFSDMTFSTVNTSLDSLSSMQSIFELDNNSNVVLKGRVGQGYYGDVFRGTLEDLSDEASEPRTVAVKKLKSFSVLETANEGAPVSDFNPSSYLQDFEREISIMKSLKHPNIVEILGVLREPDLLLVMEFVPHGSLQSYLKINKEKLRNPQLLKYASDIANGMDYLGKKNIVHRDLAARNILVVDENHVKISDFGLAQSTGSSTYYILKSPNRQLPIKWYAPESLAEGKFSVKSDVWSYGVTLFEMFAYGEDLPPLGNVDKMPEDQKQQALYNALMSGVRFPCPEHCPHAVYVTIMRPCWVTDPHDRPTFRQLAEEIDHLMLSY